MASRKLKFDASKPVRGLEASPATRIAIAETSSQQLNMMSPKRVLATPTRPSQRATLARLQLPQAKGIVDIVSPTQFASLSGARCVATRAHARPALQQITEQDRFRNNAEGAENQHPKGIENKSQKDRLSEWIYAYRHAFPSFRFYFDRIDDATARRLAAPIQSLGAKVEAFFSTKSVTHVIVKPGAVPAGSNNSNESIMPSGSRVVSHAKQAGLKVWDVEKLEHRVLAFLLPGFSANNANSAVVSAKRKLTEAFESERVSTQTPRHLYDPATNCIDFYYFKYYYVLVEDSTHLNRPVLYEDYRPPEQGRDPPWPKLYMVPQGRCPFVQYEDPTTSSKGSEEEEEEDEEDNKENITPEPEDNTPTAPLSKTPIRRHSNYRLNTPQRKPWTPPISRNTPRTALPNTVTGISRTLAGNRRSTIHAGALLTPTQKSRAPVPAPAKGTARIDQHYQQQGSGTLPVIDSIASGVAQSRGVTSTSTAFHLTVIDPATQQSMLQNLNGGRVTQLSRLEQPVTSTNPANDKKLRRVLIPRTKKPRISARRPVVARPGFCENCRVKYDDMVEHIKTDQHRRFATTERNWVELDALLAQIERPLAKNTGKLSNRVCAKAITEQKGQITADESRSAPVEMAQSSNISGTATTAQNIPKEVRLIPSTHMLASGRLSTGTDCTAEKGIYNTQDNSTQMLQSRNQEAIDLTYSGTNTSSSKCSPDAHDTVDDNTTPPPMTDNNNGVTDSLVTPAAGAMDRDANEAEKTLVELPRTSILSHNTSQFDTPTKPKAYELQGTVNCADNGVDNNNSSISHSNATL